MANQFAGLGTQFADWTTLPSFLDNIGKSNTMKALGLLLAPGANEEQTPGQDVKPMNANYSLGGGAGLGVQPPGMEAGTGLGMKPYPGYAPPGYGVSMPNMSANNATAPVQEQPFAKKPQNPTDQGQGTGVISSAIKSYFFGGL